MRNYFILILCLLLFQSCKDEVLVIDEDIPQIEEEYVYQISFTVESNDVNMRDLTAFKLRLKDIDAQMFPFLHKDYDYLDSLIWRVEGIDKAVNLYSNNRKGSKTIGWSHAFNLPGIYKTYLHGYKDNRLVIADTISINVFDKRDFLEHNWNSLSASMYVTSNYANEFYDYDFGSVVTIKDNNKSIVVYPRPTDRAKSSHENSKIALKSYMDKLYGKSILELGDDKLGSFLQEYYPSNPSTEEVLSVWQNPTTNIFLVKYNLEEYKIVAFPRT